MKTLVLLALFVSQPALAGEMPRDLEGTFQHLETFTQTYSQAWGVSDKAACYRASTIGGLIQRLYMAADMECPEYDAARRLMARHSWTFSEFCADLFDASLARIPNRADAELAMARITQLVPDTWMAAAACEWPEADY